MNGVMRNWSSFTQIFNSHRQKLLYSKALHGVKIHGFKIFYLASSLIRRRQKQKNIQTSEKWSKLINYSQLRARVYDLVCVCKCKRLFTEDVQGPRNVFWIGGAERASNARVYLRGSGGMFPRKILKFRAPKITRNAYIYTKT